MVNYVFERLRRSLQDLHIQNHTFILSVFMEKLHTKLKSL